MYENEGCWPVDLCTTQEITDRIIGNPIYNYQVLRRVVIHFKNVEAKLKEIDTKSKTDLLPYENLYVRS